MGAGERKYRAFLSYAHSDLRWANSLHRALEGYAIPRRLVGQDFGEGPIPRRLFPIFRDRDELAANPSLTSALSGALERSHFLIVVCSPAATKSEWVNREIQHFISLGKRSRILTVLVAGEPRLSHAGGDPMAAFPSALNESPDDEPPVSTLDRLAADVRGMRWVRGEPLLKLVSALIGAPFDELRQRQRARSRRAWLALGLSVLTALIVWLALVDLGYAVAGGEGARHVIDNNELTLFRRPMSREQVRARVQSMRQRESALLRLGEYGTAGWWAGDDFMDPWTTAQSASGLLRGGDEADFAAGMRALAALFSPAARKRDVLVERGERRLGWMHGYKPYVMGQVGVWVGIGVAEALGRPSLSERDEKTLREYWSYLQLVFREYRPPNGKGGWNSFPSQQNPSAHDAYTSGLALQLVAAACEAKLGWGHGDVHTVARGTVDWLVSAMVPANAGLGFGWKPYIDTGVRAGPSLTVFIVAGMLRLERSCGIQFPEELIPGTRKLLREAVLNPKADSTVILDIDYTLDTRTRVGEGETINVQMSPWVIQAENAWSEHLEKQGAKRAEIVEARRAVGKLMDEFVPHEDPNAERYFVIGEDVYVFSDWE